MDANIDLNLLSSSHWLDRLEIIRNEAVMRLDPVIQAENGQYLTPVNIACLMASMFSFDERPEITLLDPGAGVGTLTAAFIFQICYSPKKPNKIKAVLYELDQKLTASLERTVLECERLCSDVGIELSCEIRNEDFVAPSVLSLKEDDNSFLFPVNRIQFDYAILNPPYKKIIGNSPTRKLLDSIGLGTSNLYAAFLWLTIRLLKVGGQIVAITPRSYCNGPYFRTFRQDLSRIMSIQRIHVFNSRSGLFDDVLQENIILSAVKSTKKPLTVTISRSDGLQDDDLVIQRLNYDQLIQPNDPEKFIRIISDRAETKINSQMNCLHTTLVDLGIQVSTGRVVEFRNKEHISSSFSDDLFPLIYPANIKGGYVLWPLDHKKGMGIKVYEGVDEILVPNTTYVLVKRFSAKEEKRRIFAAILEPSRIRCEKVAIENHLNYFYQRYGQMSPLVAKGLAVYLNSTLVDQYFRQFSGHTQVNASDLRSLKYPTYEQLIKLGQQVGEIFPSQDQIDQMIEDELALNGDKMDENTPDPIRAKKRIREALDILQQLELPRQQQNDRSALTLLALTNIQAITPWNEASSPLLGITEMMDFFRKHYGIDYAPNTRETVRRQTIHQFIQTGIVLENPDDRNRPINSPKTKYQIESHFLTLLRGYGSQDWPIQLALYRREALNLTVLQVQERVMTLIPVTLPGGANIFLTPGGQNRLIKRIVEEFCPRFTPGGAVVYIGDAGAKINEREKEFFEKLNVEVDPHGKLPDVIVHVPGKNWLILIEAVTSHGPIDQKRKNELDRIVKSSQLGIVYVTAFETRKSMLRFLSVLAWETEVWIADTPSHLIHFNGEKFLGPSS